MANDFAVHNGGGILGPVVLDVAGYELTQEEKEVICHPYVGGIIFFRRNFESPEQIKRLVGQIRALRSNIVIAVDQEGGRVQRFKEGFTCLPSLQKLATAYLDEQGPHFSSTDLIKGASWLMASELLAVGVDISFAPVVDADDDFSQVIGDRSFSKNVKLVSLLGRLFIEGMHEAGMPATLKHFPGHGAVVADSHLALPVDGRSLNEVWETDLLPFRELLPMSEAVMPAHILFSEVDNYPVGFSRHWLQEILRDKMQYQGVIFSDDLSMEGASVAGDHTDRAVAALRAGCDSVVVCNNPQKAIDVLQCLQTKNWPLDNRLMLMKAQNTSAHYSLCELKKTDRWNREFKILQELEG